MTRRRRVTVYLSLMIGGAFTTAWATMPSWYIREVSVTHIALTVFAMSILTGACGFLAGAEAKADDED